MSIINKPVYEISIWDDVLTYNITVNGETTGKNVTSLPTNLDYVVNYQFFDEIKQAVIGANGMDSAFRAHNPVFTRNVNGSITLTFTMYNHVYDYDLHDYVENPFIKKLTNERKIKLKYPEVGVEDPWYDLIIKSVQESSDNKTYSYTATSMPVNELAKNGYNVELDPELFNNQGTIIELAEKILQESDWTVDVANSDLLRQWIEEPIYEFKTSSNINIKSLLNPTSESISLGGSQTAYMFYSYFADKQTKRVQIILPESLSKRDATNVIIEPEVYVIETDFTWNDNGLPTFASSFTLYTEARAQRLEFRQKNVYDEVLERNVYEYEKDNTTYYGYSESKYISPQYVRNLVTNGSNLISTSGWHLSGDVTNNKLEIVYDPPIGEEGWIDGKSYLHLDLSDNAFVTNQGIFDNKTYLKGIAEGQSFVLRINTKDNNTELNPELNSVSFSIYDYKHEIEYATFERIATPTLPTEVNEDGETIQLAPQYDYDFVYYEASWNTALSESELLNKIPTLCIQSTEDLNIHHIELFEKIVIDDALYVPGTMTGEDLIIQDIHYLYQKGSAETKEDIVYEHKGLDIPAEYIPVYNENDNFEKIRSITGKESNRYNLIQNLCETFECWADFKVKHDNMGKIDVIFEKDENNNITRVRQNKAIAFRKNVGNKNYAGFRYGINLKSIQRTLDSNQLSSKVIVKANSNELAEGGFCSIADATENPLGENFLLCFDYYVQHGLLPQGVVVNDLYDTTLSDQGYLGYATHMYALNVQSRAIIKQSATLAADISELEANQQVLNQKLNESRQLAASYKGELYRNSNFSYEDFVNNNVEDEVALDNKINQNYILQISLYEKTATEAETALVTADDALNKANAQMTENDEKLAEIRAEKDELNRRFYAKYARFIQEGTWTSEDYIDPNLYYLDAYNVAKTSAFPKVTYTINVIGLEGNDEYIGYSFKVGDLSYIEDTEFFGYVWVNGAKTPYHEEVVVSERIDNLDSPESNQIKVQNYKTQFQDLFQRIEATSQAVEYSRGTLNTISNIVNDDGTINVNVLQNSLANNSLIIQNAKNQSVVWDDQGITVTNLLQPAEVVRITSGGILLSQDGGLNYLTGISANGINANYITSGQLDTGVLVIRNGSFPSFRWDSNGISAYVLTTNGYNYNQYVRYDQYGLYGAYGGEGIQFTDDDNFDARIGKIKEHAAFSLTWKGFRLNNKSENGSYIDISSENDIRIISNDKTRIKLGDIQTGTGNSNYGLAIFDDDGNAVLKTEDDGQLWLKKALHISSSDDKKIEIGYLDAVHPDPNKNNIHETMNVNDNFIVYEDGSMTAQGARIQGHIEATSGKIGNMDVAAIDQLGYQVVITSSRGEFFKDETSTTILTARLMQGGQEIEEGVSYQWRVDNQDIVGANSKTHTVDLSVLTRDDSIKVYTCVVTLV